MKDCPDFITWQALADKEIQDPALCEHLDCCAVCRESYRQIAASAALADGLFTPATLSPDFARRVLRRVKPFPAGLVAALLFFLLAAAVAFLDPNGLQWWLSAGMTRQVGFILDTAISFIYLLQNVGPDCFFVAAATLVALEILVLHKIQTAKE